MFCKNCGKPIDGMNFCPACGTPVEEQAKITLLSEKETPKPTEETPQTAKKSSGKRPLLIAVPVLVAVVLVGVISVVIGSKHNTDDSANINDPSVSDAVKDDAANGGSAKTDESGEFEPEQSKVAAEETEYIDGYIDWLMPVSEIRYDGDGLILNRQWNEYTLGDDGCLMTCSVYDEDGLQGTIEVTGNSIVTKSHEEDGIFREMAEWTYAGENNLLSWKLYWDGALDDWEETTYAADGNVLSWKWYNSDGTSREEIYDINGNVAVGKSYDDAGNLSSWSEYAYDTNGNLLGKKSYDGAGNLRSWSECLYDIIGNVLYRKSYGDDEASNTWSKLIYDDNGNVCRHEYYDDDGDLNSWNEYMYDTNGNVLNIKEYSDEGGLGRWNEYTYAYTYDNAGNVLSCQREKYVHQGPMYQEVGIVSHETEMYTFDANGKMLSENYYDGKGFPYECIYNTDGNMLSCKYYSSEGALISRSEYTYDDSGNILSYKEYGRDGELLEHTEYEYTLVRAPAWLCDVLVELFY